MSPDQVERLDEDLLRDATRGDNAAFVAYCDRKLPGARDFFARALRRNWTEAPPEQVADFLRTTIDSATLGREPVPGGWPPHDRREDILLWLRRGSSGELLRRAVGGDDTAYVVFASLAMPDLRNVLLAVCRKWGIPPEMAGDFIQETLTRTVHWLKAKPREEPLWPGWIPVVARRIAIDWMRKHKGPHREPDRSAGALADVPSPPEDPHPARDLDDGHDLDQIRKRFKMLEVADRRLLNLIVVQGQRPDLAAAELNLEPVEVHTQLHRALSRLKALLDEEKVRAALQALSVEKRPLRKDDRCLVERVLFEGQPPPEAKTDTGKWASEYKRFERAMKRLRDKLDSTAMGGS
jgi:RNA polymerase sigma factor (sigma-70 family)